MSTLGTLLAVTSFNRLFEDRHSPMREMGRRFGLRLASSLAAAARTTDHFDVVIVGGGIVGTATARQLSINKPQLKMAILEKEAALGQHQTGHNSGVIHAGIYYKPGSLKARLCVEGSALAYEYLDAKALPYKRCGKLIVATDATEVARLDELWKRALQNRCPGVQLLESAEAIAAIEPNCVGLKAIWSPNTGIVDWGRVNQSYAEDFARGGGQVLTSFEVAKFTTSLETLEKQQNDYPIVITGADGREVRAKYVITAAGLHSDKVAKLTNGKKVPKIVPFRGEYLVLKAEKSDMVKTNIYPVPDPRFPFLGVHFTPRMDGSIWLGPNAVLAFKREGYTYWDLSPSELFESLFFSGFRKLAFKYFSAGMDEFRRSLSAGAQLKQLQRFVPSITLDDIDLTKRVAGVRAQALDAEGNLVDDFVFETNEEAVKRVLHVRNAPSPGATSSLAIAKVVAEKAQTAFGL